MISDGKSRTPNRRSVWLSGHGCYLSRSARQCFYRPKDAIWVRAEDRKISRGETAGLLLHENLLFSLMPPHGGIRQYWRDFESLERWARSEPHRIWWSKSHSSICGLAPPMGIAILQNRMTSPVTKQFMKWAHAAAKKKAGVPRRKELPVRPAPRSQKANSPALRNRAVAQVACHECHQSRRCS